MLVKHFVVVITGASGSAYGMRAVEQLLVSGHAVSLVATPTGAEVMAYETGFRLPETAAKETVLRFLELPPDAPLRVVHNDDLFDAVASGSSPVDGVIVIPASMGFIGSIASGLASDLAERAADVALKERRPLVLVPRETPLNLIHLRNLTALAEAGAIIVPAMPAFYQRPETLDDQVNFVVGKALDVLGLTHELYPRWRE
jgi:4-hydroxy-3-polyprenylbenzoate decarboxylase